MGSKKNPLPPSTNSLPEPAPTPKAGPSRKHASNSLRAQAVRLKILADASQVFASAGQDYQAVLDQVARQLTESLADMCQIRLLSDDGKLLELAAVHSVNAELSMALRALKNPAVDIATDPGLAAQVFRTGKPALVPAITLKQLWASNPPEYRQLFERYKAHSFMLVALRVQGRSIGGLGLTRYRSELPAFSEDDLSLAQDLADRAALAINSAQLYKQVQEELTERKRAEKQIIQMERLYATLSQVNQTIVRVKDRTDLYQSICNVSVKFGEFSLAWVGLIDEATGDVRPVAANGLDVAQWPFQIVNIHKGTSKSGLVATAIRTSKVMTSEDIEVDKRTRIMREQYSKFGYHSSAAVPFHLKGETIGMLNLISPEAGLFKAKEEVSLLKEIGLDISFALDSMETEAERKRVEEALRESEQRYSLLFDKSPVPAALLKLPEVVIVDVNNALEKLVGSTRQEMRGKTAVDLGLTTPANRSQVMTKFEEQGSLVADETVFFTRSGQERIVLINTNPMEFSGQRYALTTMQDITERKQAEMALRRSEHKFSSLFDKSVFAISLSRLPDGVLADVNKAFEQVFGYTKQEAIGRTSLELGINPDAEGRAQILAELKEYGTARNHELVLRTKLKEPRMFSVNVDLVDIDGQKYILNTTQDITERKRAEKQVVQMERLYATLSQMNQTIVRVKDRDNLYQSICDVAVKFGEFSLAWVGLLDETSGEVRPVAANGLDVAQWPFKIINIHKDILKGGLVATAVRTSKIVTSEDIEEDKRTQSLQEQFSKYNYHSTAAVPFGLRDKTIGILALISNEVGSFKAEEEVHLLEEMGLDISFALDSMETEVERKQLEENLKQSESKYRLISENADDWVYWISPDHTFRYCSPSCERVSGYSAQEFTDTPSLIDKIVHPEDAEIFHNHSINVNQEDCEGLEFRIIEKNDSIRWINHSCNRIFSQESEYLGRRVTNRDITDRKLAEEEIRKLNAELEGHVIRRTAQLEAANKELEAFSYSVSHDLRAPLRAINGYTNILVEDYAGALDTEGQRVCNVIISESQRMGKLIDNLLSFSRLSRAELHQSRIDMQALVQTIFDELAPPEGRKRIDLHLGKLQPAMGDVALIRQVWVNLLSNALKFTSGKERAVIEVESTRNENEIIYSVRDNGAGFDMQYADKLFGVFQRLHSDSEFEGTGVGLAIVQRVINRHGGRVWGQGKIDQGAVFYFSLPGMEA